MNTTTIHNHVDRSLPQLPVSRLVGHDGPVQAVVFTADGKYCITGGYDRTVRLWNPARLDPVYPLPTIQQTDNMSDRSISDLPRALPIQTYTDGITHSVSSVAVGDNSNNSNNNSVNNTQSQPQWLLVASDKTAVVHNLVTGQCVRRIQGHNGRINHVTFSAGAETYLTASYDATVRIWDGRSRSTEPIQILKDAKDSVTVVQTDQNGGQALIRTASVDGILRTYDLRKGIIQCDDCNSPIIGMAPTYDGNCIAVSCLDGTIRLVDCFSGELQNTFHSTHVAGTYGLNCCITANDGNVVTGSENGTVVFYDLVRANPVQILKSPPGNSTAPTCAVACHPLRSDVVVSACYDTNTVVWANDIHYMSWE